MNLRKKLRLYAITDNQYMANNFVQNVKDSINGGVSILQVRAKNKSDDEMVAEISEIQDFLQEHFVPLIVNDRVDVMAKVDADGVHLGQDDAKLVDVRKCFPDKIIGVTVKTLEQAIKAEQDGADYLGVGAIFSSPTKPNAINTSIETLQAITRTVKIPVVAIGGITADNVDSLKDTGISGVAVISEIYDNGDVKTATNKLYNKVKTVLTKNVLTIAGSDSSGGAGIQADIKTMTAHGQYAMSVITALTAQNTLAVDMVEEVSVECVSKQLDSVFTDIRPHSVKVGMVANVEIIKTISGKLKQYNAENVVVDPVMVSTSGCKLIHDDSIETLKKYLFPLARVITPNVPEAEILAGIEIKNENDMIKAAEIIGKDQNFAVLVKGGHLVNDATDILYEKGEITKIQINRVDCLNTHGTGCTLSSAIACNLADNYSLVESIALAKQFLVNAMQNDLQLGKGSGPLNHIYNISLDYPNQDSKIV